MPENYFIEKINHQDESYTVTHNVTADWNAVKPDSLQIIIKASTPDPVNALGKEFNNLAAMEHVKTQLHLRNKDWHADQGRILAYAVKCKPDTLQDIYDVVQEYNYESPETKKYLDENYGHLISKFINRDNFKISDWDYCNWLTYCQNINTVAETVTANRHEWGILAWRTDGNILARHDYDVAIIPVKNWLTGNCYLVTRDSDQAPIDISHQVLTGPAEDIKKRIKQAVCAATGPTKEPAAARDR